MLRNNTPHTLEEYTYCTILEISARNGYAVQYYRMLKYISTAFGNVGYLPISRSKPTPVLNVFVLELQFTNDGKAPSAQEVTLN